MNWLDPVRRGSDLEIVISKYILCIEIMNILVNLLSGECQRSRLLISQPWFRQWLVVKQHSTTRPNGHPYLYMSSHGVARPQWVKEKIIGWGLTYILQTTLPNALLIEKICIFIRILLGCVLKGIEEKGSTLLSVKACCWTGNKSLPERLMTHLNGA